MLIILNSRVKQFLTQNFRITYFSEFRNNTEFCEQFPVNICICSRYSDAWNKKTLFYWRWLIDIKLPVKRFSSRTHRKSLIYINFLPFTRFYQRTQKKKAIQFVFETKNNIVMSPTMQFWNYQMNWSTCSSIYQSKFTCLKSTITLFWCRYCLLWTDFPHWSGIFIDDFKQIDAGWAT